LEIENAKEFRPRAAQETEAFLFVLFRALRMDHQALFL
jgi:hypothetical protein